MLSGEKNTNKQTTNLKYLTRCQYYGKLINWEYVSEAMILIFNVYTATEYFGGNTNIRVYVPTDLEKDLEVNLVQGDNYLIITAPYRIRYNKTYNHRVDMLINIFQEVI